MPAGARRHREDRTGRRLDRGPEDRRTTGETGEAPRSAAARRLLELQRLVGNQAVADLADTDSTGVQQTGPPDLAPGGKAAPAAPTHIDQARAKEVLDLAFQAYVTIDAGKVVVAGQADFQKHYDSIWGSTIYSWAKWVAPKFGNLEGFADKSTGTVYINSAKQSLDTVPHEMLHTNASSSWKTAVSSELNEGVTEWLTIKAVTAQKYTATHSYPNQEGVVRDLVGVVGEDALMTAYFKGTVEPLKTKVDAECTGTWEQFNAAMTAAGWVRAKALLKPKPKPAAPAVGPK